MRIQVLLLPVAVATALVTDPALAQSRCDQLASWASCLETRASSSASATIRFTDNQNEFLNPTGSYVNGPVTVVNGVSYQTGYNYGAYSGFGLEPDDGPLLQVAYRVANGGSPLSDAYEYDVQQATPAWLAGGYTAATIAQNNDVTTRFGTNHGAVQLSGTIEAPFVLEEGNGIHPGVEGTVTQNVLGSAQSIWHDTVTFSQSGLVSFGVSVTGTLDDASWLMYGLTAIDGGGNTHAIANDFVGQDSAGALTKTLTGSLSVVAGQSYLLGGSLYAYVQNAAGLTDVTAQLTSIKVDPGNVVTFASNSPDWTGVVTAVPEPETYAMLLAGLGLIGAVARRRTCRRE